VRIPDRRHTAAQRRSLSPFGDSSRQICGHRLRRGWQGADALGLAPFPEQTEVRPIGLAGSSRLLGLSVADRGRQVRCQRGWKGGI
jgi:hypothetical protein